MHNPNVTVFEIHSQSVLFDQQPIRKVTAKVINQYNTEAFNN